jgi:hypothetical protein
MVAIFAAVRLGRSILCPYKDRSDCYFHARSCHFEHSEKSFLAARTQLYEKISPFSRNDVAARMERFINPG